MVFCFLSPQSVIVSGPNSNSFKLLGLSLLPSGMRNIHSNKSARVVTTLYIDFSVAQGQLTPVVTTILPSMGIFQDTQGKLTPWSTIWSCKISYPPEILSLSLPVKIKIQLRMKARQWLQHHTLIFQMLEGSWLRSRLWKLAKIHTHPSYYDCPCYLLDRLSI